MSTTSVDLEEIDAVSVDRPRAGYIDLGAYSIHLGRSRTAWVARSAVSLLIA